jgi:hypothetical protein
MQHIRRRFHVTSGRRIPLLIHREGDDDVETEFGIWKTNKVLMKTPHEMLRNFTVSARGKHAGALGLEFRPQYFNSFAFSFRALPMVYRGKTYWTFPFLQYGMIPVTLANTSVYLVPDNVFRKKHAWVKMEWETRLITAHHLESYDIPCWTDDSEAGYFRKGAYTRTPRNNSTDVDEATIGVFPEGKNVPIILFPNQSECESDINEPDASESDMNEPDASKWVKREKDFVVSDSDDESEEVDMVIVDYT